MTFWARLTWQVAEPAALAADLQRSFGMPAVSVGGVSGALSLSLGTALLELRPWRPEGAADRPHTGGRLVFEPMPEGDEPPRPGAPGSPPAVELAGVGWATVDLDRAEAELDPWLAPRSGLPGPDRDEPHLGARARCRGAGGLPAGTIVLLQPRTEGRLAASLARDGEGPCALYLAPRKGLVSWRRAARTRGIVVAAGREGPLGPSVLVLGGGVAGPHLIVVDRAAADPVRQAAGRSSAGVVTGTIAS